MSVPSVCRPDVLISSRENGSGQFDRSRTVGLVRCGLDRRLECRQRTFVDLRELRKLLEVKPTRKKR